MFTGIKVVLFDFDETLAVHSDAVRKSYISDPEVYYSSPEVQETMLKDSTTNKHLSTFMDSCVESGISVGLISGDRPEAIPVKLKWVEENYGHKLLDYCVSSQEEKVLAYPMIAKEHGCSINNILVIDDNVTVLCDAIKLGCKTATPIEIVNLCDK